MFIRKLSTTTQRHLRQYNPFVEFKTDVRTIIRDFKTDVNNTLDKHIQMTNMVTIAGFGGLGGGLAMLYNKTETDKKELKEDAKELNAKSDKIEANAKELNTKMDLILIQISKPKNSWF